MCKISDIHISDEEADHRAPFQVEIIDLVKENAKHTFTVEHQYQLRLSCNTSDYPRSNTLECLHWTDTVSLLGDQQVFLSKDVEFESRQNRIDKTTFEVLLSTEGKKVYCNMNATQSIYIILMAIQSTPSICIQKENVYFKLPFPPLYQRLDLLIKQVCYGYRSRVDILFLFIRTSAIAAKKNICFACCLSLFQSHFLFLYNLSLKNSDRIGYVSFSIDKMMT